MHIRTRRVYDPPTDDDGLRVLVDRLWPRGVRREDAAIDRWPKDVTPSSELRRWYHADRSRYDEFVRRYREELDDRDAALRELLDAAGDTITLVTAVRTPDESHVPVLRDRLAAMVSA